MPPCQCCCVGVLSAVVVVTVLVAVTLLAGTVKVRSAGSRPRQGRCGRVAGPARADHPPAVPTTTLPVTFAAVLVPLLR